MHEGHSFGHPSVLLGVPVAGGHLGLDDNLSFAPILASVHKLLEQLLKLRTIDFTLAVYL